MGLSHNDQDDKIVGGTDDTIVGNVGDRLKVDIEADVNSNIACPTVSNDLEYDLDTTGLTLTGSYQTVTSYTGSGKLIAFALSFTKTNVQIKLTVDSEVIFEVISNDLNNVLPSSGLKGVGIGGIGWDNSGSKLLYDPACPIAYETEYKIEARRNSSNPNLNESLVVSTKVT